jgi:catechol 2,3-dioxygenase-like lactoylglutathione lyase family enzyme
MGTRIIVTVPTERMQDSVRFYTGILGFTVDHRFQRPGGVELTFMNHRGFIVELAAGPNISAGEIGSGAPLLTFMTDDFIDITARLSSAGIPAPAAVDLPGGISMLRFRDPNGVVISFVKGHLES